MFDLHLFFKISHYILQRNVEHARASSPRHSASWIINIGRIEPCIQIGLNMRAGHWDPARGPAGCGFFDGAMDSPEQVRDPPLEIGPARSLLDPAGHRLNLTRDWGRVFPAGPAPQAFSVKTSNRDVEDHHQQEKP